MACFILLRRETEDRCDKIIKTASVRWLYYFLIHSLARMHTRTCTLACALTHPHQHKLMHTHKHKYFSCYTDLILKFFLPTSRVPFSPSHTLLFLFSLTFFFFLRDTCAHALCGWRPCPPWIRHAID